MKKLMRTVMAACAGALALVGEGADGRPDLSAAIERGAAFLLAQQAADGHWSDAQMPALTALPVWALCGSGVAGSGPAISNGVQFVLATQRADGGFYVPKPGRGGSGLGNYNTSVCLSALFASGRAAEGEPEVLDCGKYAGMTVAEARKAVVADLEAGGFLKKIATIFRL